ncbi:MAG: SDR family NAD(P)-dependent oxidoreductase [Erythrobacter sp.]|uniref:SDR family NAD(P)-dependent oxidoreductase n=1 Tax=Erythrobacter sp. TaxID=1042 RepID=UPI00262CA785|nr:SDR family NAD(P)-dependent oxidoreductase [Erythrobacter sp.]MDJ0979709.1 SDR family NAD(P)-dependent oxidoreductase [Erythrobacter sp.]
MSPDSRLRARSGQRHALITGAARGIGLGIARKLASDGYSIIALDHDSEALEASARFLPRKTRLISLDVTDREAVSASLNQLPALNAVVNNAGLAGELLPVAKLDPESVRRILKVNVKGAFIVSQEALPRMKSGSAIINIASRGYLGGAGGAHYVASKAGLVGMTRAMAAELRWRKIRVNAVAPGMVETRMLEGFTPKMKAALERLEPEGRAADPEEIAGIVSFLASDASKLISGQVLLADGGKSLGTMPY